MGASAIQARVLHNMDGRRPDRNMPQAHLLGTEGNPLVLYHGTAEIFETFSKDRVGSCHADIIREDCEDESLDPTAFYFTNDPETAIWYAKDSAKKLGIPEMDGVVISVALSMATPKKVNFQGEGREYLGEEIEGAKRQGNDGLICRNYDDGGVSDHYVVFDASQIKILKATTVRAFKAGECKVSALQAELVGAIANEEQASTS